MVKWRKIKEFENYQVSNDGRIRNKNTKKVLKPWIRNGYYSITLRKDSKSFTKNIHKIVGITWLKKTLNSNFINHIDGNKLNNKLENLEFVTPKQNTKHAIDNNLTKPNVKKVKQYTKDGIFLKEFASIKEAEGKTGVSNKHIGSVCRGKRKTTGGYVWKYSDDIEINIQIPKGKKIKEYSNYILTKEGRVFSVKTTRYLIPKKLPSGYKTVKLCNSYKQISKDHYIRKLMKELYPNIKYSDS